jgi:antitoxin (DNA-binding transcriptional repressor) of toxin-antitoxin stability system
MQSVDINQAQSLLPQLLDAVLRGEEIIITRDDKPIAKLLAVNGDGVNKGNEWKPGSAKGLIRMRKDFDEPLEDFAEYT